MTLIGVFYSIARIIVVLTPTPKDDAKLEQVAGWLRGLAALFGLNIKQGR